MSSRALRRHHRARIFARAWRMYKQWGDTDEELSYWCCRRADNMAWCNRTCCGGPRRNHGFNVNSWRWGEARTRQELLALLSEGEWEAER